MWLQTLKTRLVAPEIPRNRPMIIWKAFVLRFLQKSRMLTITTQAYSEYISQEVRLHLSYDSTNLALVSLPAAACCFCCSEQLLEVITAYRRNQRHGRIAVYTGSSLDSKNCSSRSSALTEVVETQRDFKAQALSVSLVMMRLAQSTMTCSR